jgi:hypothetical protein
MVASSINRLRMMLGFSAFVPEVLKDSTVAELVVVSQVATEERPALPSFNRESPIARRSDDDWFGALRFCAHGVSTATLLTVSARNGGAWVGRPL